MVVYTTIDIMFELTYFPELTIRDMLVQDLNIVGKPALC